MKQIVIFAATAVVLFAASAAGSWKLASIRSAATNAEAEAESNDKAPAASSHGKSSKTGKSAKTQSSKKKPAESHSTTTSKKTSGETGDDIAADSQAMRLAARTSVTSGVEETIEMANALRARMDIVKERESQLLNRQKQLELIYEDIRAERAAVDELRKQVETEVQSLEHQRSSIEEQQSKMEKHKGELTGMMTEIQNAQQANLKKVGKMCDNMAPEASASILKELVDSGSIDTATQFLAEMTDKQAAKVLFDLNDPAIAAQLLQKVMTIKRPTPAPSR